jgi:hypothetical protein
MIMKRHRLVFCVLLAFAGTILLATQGPAQQREGDRPHRRRAQPERGRSDRPGPRRDRRSPRHAPARVKVWQFEHISAASAMATLEQLADAPEFGEPMERLPLAVNTESNTIVAVAPEEALDILDGILSGIDKPRPEPAPRGRQGRPGPMRMLPMSPHGGHLSRRLGQMTPPATGRQCPTCPRMKQMKQGGQGRPGMCPMRDKMQQGGASGKCPMCARMKKMMMKAGGGESGKCPMCAKMKARMKHDAQDDDDDDDDDDEDRERSDRPRHHRRRADRNEDRDTPRGRPGRGRGPRRDRDDD